MVTTADVYAVFTGSVTGIFLEHIPNYSCVGTPPNLNYFCYGRTGTHYTGTYYSEALIEKQAQISFFDFVIHRKSVLSFLNRINNKDW